MKRKLFLICVALLCAVGSWADTDCTSSVSTTGWKKTDGTTAADATGTWAMSHVTVGANTDVPMYENYNKTTCATTGIMLQQTVSGLTNGTYTVELYANSIHAYGVSLGDGISAYTDARVYLFANNQTLPVTVEEVNTKATSSSYTLRNVQVTDGTLHLGLRKNIGGTNWQTIQIKSLTLVSDPVSTYGALISSATVESPVDATFFIQNPSFETATYDGWTKKGDTSQFDVRDASISPGKDGKYVLNSWWLGLPVTQTVTNLLNGYYQMSANIASSDNDNDGKVFLTANGEHSEVFTFEKQNTDKGYLCTYDFYVSNNEATIGIVGAAADGTYTADGHWWYKVDNFQLKYYGDPLKEINAKITAVGELPYADPAKKPSTYIGTSASDATSHLASLTTALRAYVESNGLAEGVAGATNYTSSILEPSCLATEAGGEDATYSNGTWTCYDVRANGGKGYTNSEGVTKGYYFDSNGKFWNQKVWGASLEQTVSDLPRGKYLLTVTSRSSGDYSFLRITGNGTYQTVTNPYNVFGDGWDDTSVEFTVGAAGTAAIEFAGNNGGSKYKWFSADNFRLVRIGDLDAVTIAEAATSAPTTSSTEFKDVTLTRTLNNAYWNTFCSPIDIDAATIVSTFGAGTLITEFDTSKEVSDNTLTFKDASSIVAGKPYLIKPANKTTNPKFNGVKVTASSGQTITNGSFKFIGVIPQTALTQKGEGGSVNYFVNKSNEVVRLSEDGDLMGMRAYFNVPASVPVKLFIGGIETSIESIDNELPTTSNGEIYNLAGQRLDKAQKGVNIINGKKVLVK